MPPQPKAHLHAAVATTSVCLEDPPALTGDHNQLVAGSIDSSLSAANAAAMPAVGTAAGDVGAAITDDVTASDIAATAADAIATPDEHDDGAVAADAAATITADDTATAAVAAAGAAAATAWAGQVLLGSDEPGTDEATPPGHLLPQAKGSPVSTAPLHGEGVGKPQRGTPEQTDTSPGASSSQAQPLQMKPLAALQLPASQQPALQPHYSSTPALGHSSARGAQMSITAPSSVIIHTASSPLLLRASQPTQLSLSSGLAAPPVQAQNASFPAGGMLQQLPSIASLQDDKIPMSRPAEAEALQIQLLHGAKPISKQPRSVDAAQPGSTSLLASHTHREHDSVPPGHQSTTGAPLVTGSKDMGPLQAMSSCVQHSASQWFTSQQQPGSETSLHMQQSAPSFQTARPQAQQQLPPQLLGPASQKLHSLLLELERTAALHTTMPTSQALNPAPAPNHTPSFPSVLLQDPGLLAKVQCTLQECAKEGSQGLDQAQSQVRQAFDALSAP